MSRVGLKPIQIPEGTQISVTPAWVEVSGPKGKLRSPVPRGVEFRMDDGALTARRTSDDYTAVHGLARALAQNAVTGVSQGFSKRLEIVGIGYRAAVAGRVVVFRLGYSHTIELLMPEGIDITVEGQTKILVSGIDRQLVGQTAANIRALHPPEPYKNKGIRYEGEILRKKEGKTGAGA